MQLSSFENITEDNIVFQTAKKHKVPNSKIKYQRIKIERKLPNGKTTPLVVETPFLFSFGISERKDQETNKISGYSSDTKKFSTIFRVKGKKEVKPLDYKDKYFNTRMAIIFHSIYLRKNSFSIQVKAHEVHILPFEERKSILQYKENDDDEEENDDEDVEVESEQEEEDEHYENDEVF